MLEILQYIHNFLFLITIGFSIFYSVKYRRERNPNYKGFMQAKLNISMGIMLTLLSLYPLLIIAGSSVGIVIGAMFLLIGLFNLFAGIRNWTIYKARLGSANK